MKKIVTMSTLVLFALGTIVAQEKDIMRHQDPLPNQAKKAHSAPPADATAARTEGAAEVGSKESSKWSPTTAAAATNSAQKQWLSHGRPRTITGEVVDLSCYAQLGKTGAKHIDCGAKCARNGQPIGILTSAKAVYLLVPEEHDARRDGQASIREQFAGLMGKQVKVTGMVQQSAGGRAIFVSGVETEKAPANGAGPSR